MSIWLNVHQSLLFFFFFLSSLSLSLTVNSWFHPLTVKISTVRLIWNVLLCFSPLFITFTSGLINKSKLLAEFLSISHEYLSWQQLSNNRDVEQNIFLVERHELEISLSTIWFNGDQQDDQLLLFSVSKSKFDFRFQSDLPLNDRSKLTKIRFSHDHYSNRTKKRIRINHWLKFHLHCENNYKFFIRLIVWHDRNLLLTIRKDNPSKVNE